MGAINLADTLDEQNLITYTRFRQLKLSHGLTPQRSIRLW